LFRNGGQPDNLGSGVMENSIAGVLHYVAALERAVFVCPRNIFVIALLTAGLFLFPGCGGSPTATAPDAGSAPATSAASLQDLDKATVTFITKEGEINLGVAVARSREEKSQGLMRVERLGEDEGMIFVWDEPVSSGFWMKNTYIPLSIAFIDASLRIIDIQDMEPETLDAHNPPSPYLYAIEVNQGYFTGNGIEVGDSVRLDGV